MKLSGTKPLVIALLCGALTACSGDGVFDFAALTRDTAPKPKEDALKPETPNEEKVGVLVTGWGSPKEYEANYYRNVIERSQVGERTVPNDPCATYHVGSGEFSAHLGLRPFLIGHKLQEYERVWDANGIYKKSRDGQTYTNVVDEEIVLKAEDLEGVEITALVDLKPNFGSGYPRDPRNGKDYVAGYYQIAQGNGIPDFDEGVVAYWIRVTKMFGLKDKPEPAPVNVAEAEYLHDYFEEFFGDKVDIRHGYYEALEGVSKRNEDVAVEFAKDGIKKLVIARETTDNNNYANNFMSYNYAYVALCREGLVADMDLKQVRQVGRTPEYNHMLMKNIERHMEDTPKDEELSVLYVTYGLPWPGTNPDMGPFSIIQPWAKEVYAENAYNNYLSFRRRMEDVYGRDYKLNFNRSGFEAGENARLTSLYAYGLDNYGGFGGPDDDHRFWTLRENIEQAIRVDGRKHILAVISHWDQNSQDTFHRVRVQNGIPLNANWEMRFGKYSIEWCERYTGPGEYEQDVVRRGDDCDEGWTKLTYTEAFDDVIDLFNYGYANRLRGGVERFGVMPDLDMSVVATGEITKLGGGSVKVEEGPLAGAALMVRADPKPNAPDGYEWKDTYRAPSATDPKGNLDPNAIRPFVEFAKPEDHAESGWDDYTAMIGTQGEWRPGVPLPQHSEAVSPVVYVGPYRTLFNAPASITLPYDGSQVSDPAQISAFIFNDITGNFDPVYPVPGGSAPRLDRDAQTITFDVQTLGLFVLADAPARISTALND